MSIYRLTGRAGQIIVREGVSGEGDQRRKWSMRSQEIEIMPLVVTAVSLPDEHEGFAKGDPVDVAVDVSAKGGYLRTELRADWPTPAAGVHAVKAS